MVIAIGIGVVKANDPGTIVWMCFVSERQGYFNDVKVSFKLSDLKPLHARWIVETCNHLKHQNNSIIKGFDAAGISEAITCANDVFTRVENPFDE